jgi:MFS family permease
VIRSRGFLSVTAADFLVRSAYQMGKIPLLPMFAASLGAGDVLLGFIVAVSTLTGLVLKPFVGILSDRTGRRAWLLVGTAVFTGMPFVYGFVDSPDQLVLVRVAHGLATAIYGPVTLAYVAELSRSNRAERLGWFSMARNAGYVVGPAAAGVLLLRMDPVQVFTVIGLLSSLAFVPIVLLPETKPAPKSDKPPLVKQAMQAVTVASRSSGVWLAGGMSAQVLIAEYAIKTFLPVYALSQGVNIAVVGAYFALQEGTHLVLAPLGGRLGDRLGHMPTVALGMAALAIGLLTLSLGQDIGALALSAVLIGVAQALVFPSALASVATTVSERDLGACMGLVGAMKNSAKVAGPILAGLLIHRFGLEFTLTSMGVMLVGVALGIYLIWKSGFRRTDSLAVATGDAVLK